MGCSRFGRKSKDSKLLGANLKGFGSCLRDLENGHGLDVAPVRSLDGQKRSEKC